MKVSTLIKKFGVIGALSLMASNVMASTASKEFDGLATRFQNIIEGSGGKALALGTLVLGGGVAAAKQTLTPFFIGFVVALLVVTMPSIMTALFTATI